MIHRGGLLAVLFIVLSSPPVAASDDHAVVDAAVQVNLTNLKNDVVCKGAPPDPDRPDRVKLGRLVAALQNPNARYSFGYEDTTPLGLAILADDVELLDKLLANGARWRLDTFDSIAMSEAAHHDSPAMIRALLQHGLPPDFRSDDKSWTGLMTAAMANRADNLAVLLDAGADVNLSLPNGMSALGAAVICRNQSMVDVLVRHGARPDTKTAHLAETRGMRIPGF